VASLPDAVSLGFRIVAGLGMLLMSHQSLAHETF
jgi:hypothetical protein